MQLQLVLVYASLCGFSIGFAVASTLQLRPDPHIARAASSDNETAKPAAMPAILKFDLSKDGAVVRSCYGAHFHPLKRRIYNENDAYWILPAECMDKTKYDMIAVKYGYKDNSKAKFYFKDLFYRIHPKYDSVTKAHNIAFVGLPFPLKLEVKSGYTKVQLPSATDNFDHETLDLFEYKDTTALRADSQNNDLSNTVTRKPIMTIWCKILYPLSPIRNNHICLSGMFGTGLSKDNFGSPFIARDEKGFKLVGLTTVIRPWTYFVSFPIEVLRIEPYVDWIKAFSGER